MFLKTRASEVLTKHTSTGIHNSSGVGLISVCIFHPLGFLLYFLRGRMLTLLPAHNPGLWPAIVFQRIGDRVVAVQASQGASFLPL